MPRKGSRKPIDPAKVLADVIPPAFSPPAPKERPRLARIVENPPPRPSLEAFLDHYFAASGGPAAVALELRREYEAAEAGSQIRSRIMELVIRSLKSADGKQGGLDELGILSDADLMRLADERERKLEAELRQQAEHDAVGAEPTKGANDAASR